VLVLDFLVAIIQIGGIIAVNYAVGKYKIYVDQLLTFKLPASDISLASSEKVTCADWFDSITSTSP
jgi:hypothetical protein